MATTRLPSPPALPPIWRILCCWPCSCCDNNGRDLRRPARHDEFSSLLQNHVRPFPNADDFRGAIDRGDLVRRQFAHLFSIGSLPECLLITCSSKGMMAALCESARRRDVGRGE